MTKISRQVCGAFINGNFSKCGNTHTDGVNLYLFDNLIARKTTEGIEVSCAGYPTKTTLERLNALCDLVGERRYFYSSKGQVFFDHSPVDSKDWILLVKGDSVV